MHQKEEDSTQINWRRRGRIPQGCLGGSDPRTRVEDGVDQGRIWCEGEEGRRRGTPLFVRRQGEEGMGGCARPAGVIHLPGPDAKDGGVWVARRKRQGPWRLASLPRQQVNEQRVVRARGQTPGCVASPSQPRRQGC